MLPKLRKTGYHSRMINLGHIRDDGTCACGCGGLVKEDKCGRVRAFVLGHKMPQYIAKDGLYWCSYCKGRFPEGQITRYRDEKKEQRDVGVCRECAARKYRERVEKDPKGWRQAATKRRLSKLYGMTTEDYNAMYSAQDGKCYLCRRHGLNQTDPSSNRNKILVVDHDHESGRVRSLLCDQCNKGLGAFKDSAALLFNAANYINKFLT